MYLKPVALSTAAQDCGNASFSGASANDFRFLQRTKAGFSFLPRQSLQISSSSLPVMHAGGPDAGHDSQSGGLHREKMMFEKTADELGNFLVVHVQVDQTI